MQGAIVYREPPPYHTFILRIWLERGEQPQWRFVIENPTTGERLQFETVKKMLLTLQRIASEIVR